MNRPAEVHKRIGWEVAVRIQKILCAILHEAHKQQVEEAMEFPRKGWRGSIDEYLSFLRNLSP